MRIISGKFRGKKINLPNDKTTRPLRDLVKEALFKARSDNNIGCFLYEENFK